MKKLFCIILVFIGYIKLLGQLEEDWKVNYSSKEFYYHNFKEETIQIIDYYANKKDNRVKMDVFSDLTFHTIYMQRTKLKDEIPNILKPILIKIHVMFGIKDIGYMDDINIGKNFNTYLFYIESGGVKSAYLVNYTHSSIKSVIKIADELPVLFGDECPAYRYTTLKSIKEWLYKRQISMAELPDNLLMTNCAPFKSSLVKKFKINDSGYVEILK